MILFSATLLKFREHQPPFNMSAARSCGKKITQCLSRNPSDMETEGEWDWTALMDRFWQGAGGCDYVHECVFEPAFQGEELSCRR